MVLGCRWRGSDVGCFSSMFWPRPTEGQNTKQPGCSQRNKPGNPNSVTRHYREGDQAIGRGKSDQTQDDVDPRGPDGARTEQCDEQNRSAVKQHTDATDEMIRLQASNGGGKNVGRCEHVGRGTRKNQFVMQAFQRRLFFSLLCEQKQLVQAETTSEFRRIWIHCQRAVPVNWNFATAWQRNLGADFDLHFAHWN